MKNENYYLGLDIGTDSVGFAATDVSNQYRILKYKGEPIWGVTLFDEANLCDDRRTHRVERRRIDRRQQRILLLQELFAKEVFTVDKNFYHRIRASALFREDVGEPYCIFNDETYNDKDYHKQYPTIHHLITDLIENEKPHDVRLVYLACAWLLAHRGHFLSEVSIENVRGMTDFRPAYDAMMTYFEDYPQENEYLAPWCLDESRIADFGEILKHRGVNKKVNELQALLNNGKKFKKRNLDSVETFPFSTEGIIKLLCGGKYSIEDLFGKEEYKEFGSIELNNENLDTVISNLGDDGELLIRLKAIYDWASLCDLLKGETYISKAKVSVYNQHYNDLKFLKKFVKSNYPAEIYNKLFRQIETDNYVAYSGKIPNGCKNIEKYKKCKSQEDFCKYLMILLNLKDAEYKLKIDSDVLERIQNNSFLPKQVNSDNRVIPYQLYYVELQKILENASRYLPFLNDSDADGYIVKEKILSIMKFRIPYYVGPLNKNNNEHAWIVRKAEGKIYPWNFEQMVDLDTSNEEFIKRMTNNCTYLAGEEVLPKNSLLYQKFTVLNEINNLKICGMPIDVEIKQKIFNELFCLKKKVTPKAIKQFLVTENIPKTDAETLSGIDVDIKSSLSTQIGFSRLLSDYILNETDVEKIIRIRTYTEDNNRFSKWLQKNYGKINETDRKYICGLRIKDFGKLSGELLNGIKGYRVDLETGEICGDSDTVINFMWKENVNLSELLLSDKYTFAQTIRERNDTYYAANHLNLDQKLNQMYVSNAVKRPIIRTLDIVNDVVKATKCPPKKIFIEMARGTKENLHGKRTKSRKQQLLDLYSNIKDYDIRELSAKLENETDNRLQSDKLFLYYTQLGRCMYSGEPINIENLIKENSEYNIDHIYPQSKIKDDSVLNNKVLVFSTINGSKKDIYPIEPEIQKKMKTIWEKMKSNGLITEEKYNRLVRIKPFSEDEEWGFINRQLVETRQSTKVVAALLQEKYPNTEIVFVKAGLVSDFRQQYELLKSRKVNDLHHAKDAYLNVVCGNVYHEHFTKRWFLKNRDKYTVNMKVLLKNPITVGNQTVWNGSESIAAVKKTVLKNNCRMTFYSYKKKHGQNGGFFDQNPLRAGQGNIPRKADLPVEKYGGYNGLTTSFSVLVSYQLHKKKVVEFVPVVLLCAEKFLNDSDYAVNEYIKSRLDEKATDIKLLLDGRLIKIGTVFELDGLRVLFAGQGSVNDTRVSMKVFTPLVLSYENEQYIKAIESFVGKTDKNANLLYSKEFDRVNFADNIALYNILKDKCSQRPYCFRPENQSEKLMKGNEKFADFSIKEQCKILLNVLSLFNRTALADSLLKTTNACRLNSKISNWDYNNVRIVDMSASGLWEKKTENLIELL
ncbi:MAG: type II CRISPR RNA-guided endonuclease Cas9 [Clostridia bacterium]|nr:type II CRISPR RNA-guided endonuclease Cas9 [Clostridia bacterium]